MEAGGFLGGTGAAVLDTFYGFYAPGGEGPRRRGHRLGALRAPVRRGPGVGAPNTYGAGTGVTYEPEALKLEWDRLTAEAGAEVLLQRGSSRSPSRAAPS